MTEMRYLKRMLEATRRDKIRNGIIKIKIGVTLTLTTFKNKLYGFALLHS